ncbi:MAG: DUF2298 domain-containing protein [Methanomicrobiales archaeon]|nr:DUF2298 domain-containing protein [Methanomicrobiales archaeon]
MELQLISVIAWLVLLKGIQLAIVPHLQKTFGSLAPAVAYPASLLVLTVCSWYAALLGISVFIALVPFALLLLLGGIRGWYKTTDLKEWTIWDMVFLAGFAVLLMVRWMNPTISYAEKFMDHAFLASMMRSPGISPLDPWYAGGTLSVYYYLGYWMVATVGLLTGTPSSIAFNLGLPMILGMCAVSLYAIGRLIVPRVPWIPLLPFILANPSFILHVLQGEALGSVLWDSTRTIANTINEFPLFSFLWGDLHPHVMGLFVQVFLILLLVLALVSWGKMTKYSRLVLAVLIALALGSMPPMNTWDVLIYAPILLVVGAVLAWRERKNNSRWIGNAALFFVGIPVLSVLLYLPYYLMLQSAGVGGVMLVTSPSAPLEFLLVHGLFLAVLYLMLGRDIIARPILIILAFPFVLTGYVAAAFAVVPLIYLINKREQRPSYLLVAVGLVIIIVCEIVYLKDNMGELYYRMNTVFKCYLPAWILMGTGISLMIGKWWTERNCDLHLPTRVIAIIAVIILLVTPLVLHLDYGFGGMTLDGLAYVETMHPEDAAALPFLRNLSSPEILIEAEGGDYTYFSRISSFTGIPAVIGMPFHEYMWRGNTARVSERVADIREIYENPSRTVPLMQKYNATLLYVGPAERERYHVSLPVQGLSAIYNQSGVQVYRLQPSLLSP